MLKGRTILITGSSSGIGKATAYLARQYGAQVILHGRQDTENLRQLADELSSEYIFCDIRNKEEVHHAIEQLSKKGIIIDGLANIAGAVNPKPFLDTTEDDWLFSFKTNVLGTVYMIQEVIPQMRKNGMGTIVNIGSVRAYPQGSFASRISYCTSKAAVINLTSGIAKEYAKDGIRINSVSPGGVDTDIAKTWDDITRKRNSDVLLQRLAQPEEIAETICFLLSDKSSYSTGQDYLVDGGYLIGNN